MANSKQSKKRIRIAERNCILNKRYKTSYKNARKQAISSVQTGAESMFLDFSALQTAVDKAVTKKVIHKNKAARIKSNIHKFLVKQQTSNSQ